MAEKVQESRPICEKSSCVKDGATEISQRECDIFPLRAPVSASGLCQRSRRKSWGANTSLSAAGRRSVEWEKFKAAPHDRWWGNFVRSARVRIEQLRKQYGPTARITWLVYKPGYVRRAQRQERSDLIGNITSVRDKYGVNLVFFSNTDQLINYLNSGQPRDRVKIANFEFYGHSNKACFMFDYSNEIDSASKVWLHETN